MSESKPVVKLISSTKDGFGNEIKAMLVVKHNGTSETFHCTKHGTNWKNKAGKVLSVSS